MSKPVLKRLASRSRVHPSLDSTLAKAECRLRRILWVLAAVLAVGATIWLLLPLAGRLDAGTSAVADPVYAFEEVQLRRLVDDYVTRGAVTAEWTVDVRVSDGGTVTALSVEPGERISPGMVLGTINDRPVIAANLEAPFWRPLRIGDKGPDVRRLQEILHSEGLLDEADGSFGEATKEALTGWQELRGYSPADGVLMPQDLVPVPTDGVVFEVSAQVGVTVNAGSIIYVVGSESLQVVASIPPGDASALSVGDPATILLSDGQELAGEIVEIGAAVEDTSTLDGEPSLVNPVVIRPAVSSGLRRGENLRVTVVLQAKDDVPAVPLLAVVTDATGGSAVRVRTESGAIQLRTVELGLVDSPWVEIRSGVTPGDLVVVGEE